MSKRQEYIAAAEKIMRDPGKDLNKAIVYALLALAVKGTDDE